MKDLCVQCNREIQAQTEDGKYNVCVRPDCPNYGLVQVGADKLKEFYDIPKTKMERGKP